MTIYISDLGRMRLVPWRRWGSVRLGGRSGKALKGGCELIVLECCENRTHMTNEGWAVAFAEPKLAGTNDCGKREASGKFVPKEKK